ncbi:MAG: hypothetical protein LAO78_09545 [Acidobacteriia bacterium]|nr:hypothetical protein [Terriglobia bacterium]
MSSATSTADTALLWPRSTNLKPKPAKPKTARVSSPRALYGYRSRAEALRAETNRDLLRILAGHEDQDAARFAIPLTAKAAKSAKS